MEYLISDFFQLVLEISSKLIPDIVNKSLRISEVFSEEIFKLRSCDWSDTLMMALVLSPSRANRAMKKSDGKRDTVHSDGI